MPRPIRRSSSTNERAWIDALRRKDLSAFTAVMAPEGWAVSQRGRNSTADFVENFDGIMAATKQGTASIADESFQWIDATAVIHTFKATSKGGTFNGQSMDGVSRNTTIWVKKGDRWMGVFSQQTVVEGLGSK